MNNEEFVIDNEYELSIDDKLQINRNSKKNYDEIAERFAELNNSIQHCVSNLSNGISGKSTDRKLAELSSSSSHSINNILYDIDESKEQLDKDFKELYSELEDKNNQDEENEDSDEKDDNN